MRHKLLYVLVSIFLIISCESKVSKLEKTKINYNDKAVGLLLKHTPAQKVTDELINDLNDALLLLNKAIEIDSTYSIALSNKISVLEKFYDLGYNRDTILTNIINTYEMYIYVFNESDPILYILQAQYLEKAELFDRANQNYYKAYQLIENEIENEEQTDHFLYYTEELLYYLILYLHCQISNNEFGNYLTYEKLEILIENGYITEDMIVDQSIRCDLLIEKVNQEF